jgi:hypothetical protein
MGKEMSHRGKKQKCAQQSVRADLAFGLVSSLVFSTVVNPSTMVCGEQQAKSAKRLNRGRWAIDNYFTGPKNL